MGYLRSPSCTPNHVSIVIRSHVCIEQGIVLIIDSTQYFTIVSLSNILICQSTQPRVTQVIGSCTTSRKVCHCSARTTPQHRGPNQGEAEKMRSCPRLIGFVPRYELWTVSMHSHHNSLQHLTGPVAPLCCDAVRHGSHHWENQSTVSDSVWVHDGWKWPETFSIH